MARISISVPDSLIAKLEPIKDGINISQLCREALEQRVSAYERASSENGHELNLDSLVDRLRGERDLVGGKFESLGKQNAATWLSIAPYMEIRDVAETRRPDAMPKYKLPRAAFKTMKHDMHRAKLDCEGPRSVAYKTAWLDYVVSVWSDVIERLESSSAVADEQADQ